MSHPHSSNVHQLTLPQQSIYLDALLRGVTPKFNMGGAILIRGPLDSERFRRSLECARSVHDAQRIRFHLDREPPSQEFLPDNACSSPFEMLDFSNCPAPYQSAIDWVLADLAQAIGLEQFPLHADVVFRLGAELNLWYPKFHHASNDAFGHSLVASTVAEAYNGLLEHGEPPVFERHSYVDFIRDDREYATSGQFREDESFWHGKFPAMPEPLPFTLRKAAQEDRTLHTERCTLSVSRRVYDAAMKRAEAASVTPFQLLLACLFAYLNRTSGRNDIVVGTPILNRSKHSFRRTAGMFMNMMPLRIQVEKDASILSLAAQIKAETKACYRHQRFPLGETLRHCRLLDGFCDGVFDATLIYRKLNYNMTFGGSPIRVITLDTRVRDETLSVEIDDYNDGEDVHLFFNFNAQLISLPEAEQMARTFEMSLTDFAEYGDWLVCDTRISSVSMADPEISEPVDREGSVIDLVERRAIEDPEALAVVCGGQRLTRGELERRCNSIAAYLAGPCATIREQSVAVLCGRDSEWIAAIAGVLKAGCAYLPLDPDIPRERLDFLLRDSGCELLLAGAGYESTVFDGVRCIPVAEASGHHGFSLPRATLSPHSLAYIVYTSGTAGQPKGVMVEHGSFANTICKLIAGWEITAQDRVLGFAGPMVDASILDIFLGLASGAPLVLASKDDILDPARFLDLLRNERVTVATLPPAYLSALGAVDLPPLRLLVTAGEAANPADVARHVRQRTYVNAYGPTETSVCASYYRLNLGSEFASAHVPIGKALANTQILILDEALRPLPVGAAGELCIGGSGLARGYLNRPELNAERFIVNPARKADRLYRTGDMGRMLADGNIEFLGRRDTQVKIRGYRVELGEIEAALKMHPTVETAVVKAWSSAGAVELVAYVVPRADYDPHALRRFLNSKLPAYMLPSCWVRLLKLPLNSAGKVDARALPDPGVAETLAPSNGHKAPQTPLEATVAEIWEEVLAVTGIGREDDFFELGGHSLKAVQVLSRIQDRLGSRITLPDFFSNLTVAALAKRIGEVHKAQLDSIPHCARLDLYPLSNAQARMWTLGQLEGGLAAYNMPIALHLEGALDEGVLEHAFRNVIARHESLRTCFVTAGDIPQQKIQSSTETVFELSRRDLTDAPSAEAEASLEMRAEFALPFDLSKAPLLDVCLFRIAERRWLLAIKVHHIVADGWSLGVLLHDLSAEYASCLAGAAITLPPLRLQYRDYSQWMASEVERGALIQDRAFWMEQLAEPRAVLSLPADFPRPARLGFEGAIERFSFPITGRLDVSRFCAEHGVSPFILLLAGVFGLLHRYTGDEDISIGTPVANREGLDLEEQIGLYLNTLVLRVRLRRDTRLSELLNCVRTAVLEAHTHQNYPFDTLIRDLKVERRTDHNPLFDVMVLMQDGPTPRFEAPGIHGANYPVSVDVSVFDLTLHFGRNETGVRLELEYNTGLFTRARMERLARHLHRMIEAISTRPGMLLADVDILPDEERRRLVEEFASGPAMPAPTETVIDLFASQALSNPGRTAVVFEHRNLTYADLAAASARLADRIRHAGIAPKSVVGLLAERSEWMVAGVIGIMSTGAACLPIDAAQPRERMAQILKDGGCQALVFDGADLDSVVAGALPIIALRDRGERGGGPFASRARLADVAYVTYTSGSTGTPKGSLIEHRSLANLVAALETCLYDGLPRPATELLLTSISFDVAMKQIFAALTRGNTLVVANDAAVRDPAELMAAVANGAIHLIDLTPSHFACLLAHGFAKMSKPSLRAIVLGSEPLPWGLVEELVKDDSNRRIALFNFYGPSECTVEATYCRVDHLALAGTRIAPIGRPIANARVYVLSPDDQPTAIGIAGEICLGGSPVGRGYLNRPELTASRFVPNPFCPGERMYRTGDVGRWNDDGILEFLGRADRQLKIRGYRIEPAEIEHRLLQHPRVSEAVVEVRAGRDGSQELAAYVVAARMPPTPIELRAFLKTSLPEYMLPAAFVILPVLPLTPSGKVDRMALVEAEAHYENDRHVSPRDSLEQQLVQIWERLLSARPIGINDDFFGLGGHSLLAARLSAEIDRSLGRRLPLSRIFEFRTIAELACLLRQDVLPESSCLVTVRATGTRPRLFFLPGITGTASYLYPLAQQLGPETPFFAFQAQGLDGRLAPHGGLDEMAAHYVGLLLALQPRGPYFLAGHSFGAQIAFAMAQILLKSDREIGLLVAVDACAPDVTTAMAETGISHDDALLGDLSDLVAQAFDRDLTLTYEDTQGASVDERIARVAGKLEETDLLPKGGGVDQLRRLLNVYRAQVQMSSAYSPESSAPVPIVLVRSSEAGAAKARGGALPDFCLSEDLGWDRYSNRTVRVRYAPGNHVTMMRSPHVIRLAELIAEAMEDAASLTRIEASPKLTERADHRGVAYFETEGQESPIFGGPVN